MTTTTDEPTLTTTRESATTTLARASGAQAAWGALSPSARAKVLAPLARIIADRTDEIAGLIHDENGKPLTEAVAHEVLGSIQLLNHHCTQAPKVLSESSVRLPLSPHRKPRIYRRPFGVIIAISPWNLPWIIPMSQVLPALLAGNAVVLKPSELTPRTALLMQDVFDECRIPEGLFQVVTGQGNVGAELIDAGPDKVLFTGSLATGKKVMQSCARFPIPVALELGGVDAMIVRQDADLEFASSAAVWGGTFNGGQACCSVERLLVHESIADALRVRIVDKLSRVDPIKDLAPAVDDRQLDVWLGHVRDADEHGLQREPNSEVLPERRVSPQLVTGQNIQERRIWQEETFGPLIAMATFGDDQGAIAAHNSLPLGLTASVITSDVAAGRTLASSLRAGSVSINDVAATQYSSPELPWGGVAGSGFGKSHGDEGLLEASWAQVIEEPRGPTYGPKRPWWYPYDAEQAAGLAALGRGLARDGPGGRAAGIARAVPKLLRPLSRRARL